MGVLNTLQIVYFEPFAVPEHIMQKRGGKLVSHPLPFSFSVSHPSRRFLRAGSWPVCFQKPQFYVV